MQISLSEKLPKVKGPTLVHIVSEDRTIDTEFEARKFLNTF